MISAKEAKALTLTAYNARYETLLGDIEKRIQMFIGLGEYSCHISKPTVSDKIACEITATLIQALESKGFKVEEDDYTNYIIKW